SILNAGERVLTASDDKRQFGGPDLRATSSNPANIYSLNGANLPGLSATFAGVPAGSTGIGLTPADFAPTAGVLNRQTRASLLDIIPRTEQYGLYVDGRYQLTPSIELFAELLGTTIRKTTGQPPPPLTGGSTGNYTVPASSPFNPFGVPVGVDYFFKGFGRIDVTDDIDYVRPLVGAHGSLPIEGWAWELAALSSIDHDTQFAPHVLANRPAIVAALAATDPALSLNVFQDGPGATRALLDTLFSPLDQKFRGQLNSGSGFVRGPIASTSAGSIDAVLGGEASLEKATSTAVFNPLEAKRHSHAAFGEVRVPVPMKIGEWRAEQPLVISGALRYDHSNDFGNKTSPQIGIELRPRDALLVRGSYSTAFRPPSLLSLYRPQTTITGTIADPKRGNAPTVVSVVQGGNPSLQPTTGHSSSVGLVWTPVPRLDVAATWWSVRLKDSVGTPATQTVISNEDQFTGRVHRAPPSAADVAAGQPGPITDIDATAVNFGTLKASGIDLGVGWKTTTPVGEFAPTASATYTYDYSGADTPGGPSVDRVSRAYSTGSAPRWKGLASLGWRRELLQASLDARYVGSYLDYGTGSRKIGNDWFFDVSIRHQIGKLLSSSNGPLRSLELRVGVVNLLDKSPPYSNFQSGFLGYDPAQYDITGRFIYVQLGTKF
ncbi:MAG TPA: TonB-dependent receptor, partial [Gemmatimonadaceae bacterium]